MQFYDCQDNLKYTGTLVKRCRRFETERVFNANGNYSRVFLIISRGVCRSFQVAEITLLTSSQSLATKEVNIRDNSVARTVRGSLIQK